MAAFRRYHVAIKGESHLLIHNDNLDFQTFLKKWQMDPANKGKSTPGDDRTPAFTWIGYLYTSFGKLVIPSDNLMSMFRDGGKRTPTGKRGGTFKAQSQSGIIVDQASWPLLIGGKEVPFEPIKRLMDNPSYEEHEAAVIPMGFELFAKRATVGTSKHVRVRPRFTEWATEGTITVVDDAITTEILTSILSSAGMYVGLGDWRPGAPKAPGPFGKFTVTVKEI